MTIPVSNRFGLLTGVRAHLTARNFERNILMTVISESRYTYESGVKTLGTVVISRLDGVELILHTSGGQGLWEEFLHGAYESYCQHGAQAALDLSAVREGTSTSLFYALVEQGRVIGGVRAQVRTHARRSRTLWSSGQATPDTYRFERDRRPDSRRGGGDEIGVGVPERPSATTARGRVGKGGVTDDGAPALSVRDGDGR
ncbi:hypothetical protein GCM10020255_003940 [Rhodococcus baikonurensis]